MARANDTYFLYMWGLIVIITLWLYVWGIHDNDVTILKTSSVVIIGWELIQGKAFRKKMSNCLSSPMLQKSEKSPVQKVNKSAFITISKVQQCHP